MSTDDNGSETHLSSKVTATNSVVKETKASGDTKTKPVAENKTSLNQAEETFTSNSLSIDVKTPTTRAPATGAVTSSTSAPPTDADYKSLKSYWSQAASQNTPTGLIPEESLGRQQSQKFFVFSDKPVAQKPQRRTASDSCNRAR